MKEVFIKYNPAFSHFTEVAISGDDAERGYSIVALNRDSMPMGGGTHSDKNVARSIAIAECLERAFLNLIATHHREEFVIDKYPTSCGFACGFDDEPTKIRAICEAYERRLWEEWIDKGKYIPHHAPSPDELSPIASFYREQFDDVLFFKHQFTPSNGFLADQPIYFGIVIGIKGEGVFPGSRVTIQSDGLFEHGLIEAWRHLTVFTHHTSSQYDSTTLKRIFYFGANKDKALGAIPKPSLLRPSTPKIAFLKDFNIERDSGVYLWRAICEGLAGSIDRFIY